jgi:hypothetical protein
LTVIRKVIRQEPEVDHPRQNLERYFLEVVEKARRGATEQSGVGPSEGVARYLASTGTDTSRPHE